MTRISAIALKTTRVVAIFALTSFIPLALLTFASLSLASRAVRNEVHAGLLSTANVGATAIQNEVEGLEQVVSSYTARPSLRTAIAGDGGDADRATIRRVLDELRQVRDGVTATFISDASGRLVAARPDVGDAAADDVTSRQWYRAVTTSGRPYVSTMYASEFAERRWVVAVAAPMWHIDDPGELLGIVVAEYSAGTIERLAIRISSPEHAAVTVSDQRGTQLAAPRSNDSRPRDLNDSSGIRAALRGETAVVTDAGPDGDAVSAHAPVQNFGWTVTASVPEASAFAGIARLRSVVFVVAGSLGLVLCAGLAFLATVLRLRHRAEKELIASEHRFAQLVDALPVGLFVRTADGTPYLANREAQRLLGNVDTPAPPEQLAQKFELYVEGSDERYPAERMPILRALGGEHSIVEDMELRRDGTVVPLEVRGAPIRDADENLIYAVAMFTDITERRRAQRAIESARAEAERAREEAEDARAEAERANRAKSEFLSRMSHELRTPLNAILGFAQILEWDAKTDEELDNVQTILKGGRHLLDLINELLDIARVESGELPISLEAVDVEDALDEALELVRPLAEARNISVARRSDTDVRHYVTADRQRLKQVLLNLVSNAVKYNRESGSVVASAEAVSPETVRISVADTGPGIPKGKLDRVFAAFDRLGAEQTNVEGTGLGLTLSRALVELMGGTIAVDSSPGDGSTFWIDLPVTEGVLPDLVTVPSRTPRSSDVTAPTRTVLCIEDNVSSVKLLERVLEQRPNVRMLAATQGSLGLDLARLHHPDVILLDLNLPDMHGRDVLDRLRHEPDTADIPIVVLSADATPGQIQRLMEAGANDYLTKPINVQKTLEVLDEVLEHHAA